MRNSFINIKTMNIISHISSGASVSSNIYLLNIWNISIPLRVCIASLGIKPRNAFKCSHSILVFPHISLIFWVVITISLMVSKKESHMTTIFCSIISMKLFVTFETIRPSILCISFCYNRSKCGTIYNGPCSTPWMLWQYSSARSSRTYAP